MPPCSGVAILLTLISCLLEKRERIEFAVTVNKYDRRFKVSCFSVIRFIGTLAWILDLTSLTYILTHTVLNLENIAVDSEFDVTFFTGNEARSSLIKQAHLPDWKRKSKCDNKSTTCKLLATFPSKKQFYECWVLSDILPLERNVFLNKEISCSLTLRLKSILD